MQVNRRDFLKLSGATLAGGVALAQSGAPAAAAQADALAILYDTSKCIGCRACQEACKQWNKLPAETTTAKELPGAANLYDAPQDLSADTWTLIKLRKASDTEWHFMNYQCMHCADAACVTACPTGALYKDPLGFTGYDSSKCVGCGYCTQFCPYGVPHLKTDSLLTGKAKSAKCTFCQDRIYSGLGGPYCATSCPVGALEWGPRAELLQKAKDRVVALGAGGLSGARLYGENEAGGLGRLTILFGEPVQYNLPTSLAAPTVARLWKNIFQVLGTVAIGGTTLAALAGFLVSRSRIKMEEVE